LPSRCAAPDSQARYATERRHCDGAHARHTVQCRKMNSFPDTTVRIRGNNINWRMPLSLGLIRNGNILFFFSRQAICALNACTAQCSAVSALAWNGKGTARESYLMPNSTFKGHSAPAIYTLCIGTALFKKFHSPEAHQCHPPFGTCGAKRSADFPFRYM
jgi:hypothetical protein